MLLGLLSLFLLADGERPIVSSEVITASIERAEPAAELARAATEPAPETDDDGPSHGVVEERHVARASARAPRAGSKRSRARRRVGARLSEAAPRAPPARR